MLHGQPAGQGSNSVFFREGKFPVAASVEMLNVEGQRNRLPLYLAEMREMALDMTFLACGVCCLLALEKLSQEQNLSGTINPGHQRIIVSPRSSPSCELSEKGVVRRSAQGNDV